jgi:hypothetical protein
MPPYVLPAMLEQQVTHWHDTAKMMVIALFAVSPYRTIC